MKTVTLREAKNRLTELAREVGRGETTVVTRNGAPVFELARTVRARAFASRRSKNSSGSAGSKRSCLSAPMISTFRFRRIFSASGAARRMKLLLDTHVLLALIGPGAASLPAAVAALLRDGGNEHHLSAASLWEIGINCRLGKLKLTHELGALPELAI